MTAVTPTDASQSPPHRVRLGAIVNAPTYNRSCCTGDEEMRNLIATVLLIFSLNTWTQHLGVKPPSNPEPSVQVRQEFLRAYNAKDTDAVVAL